MLSWVLGAINTASEQRAFVFAVTFIIVFSVLIATIPTGLQGLGETPDMITALDPSIITGFSESETYSRPNFTTYQYTYDLGSRTWLCLNNDAGFALGAKVLILGFLWFGVVDSVKFTSLEGTDRGTELLFSEIATDAEDGIAQYSLQYTEVGSSAGGFVVYWNTSIYSDPVNAWTNDTLYALHGMGIEATASADIGALLISLLLLQIPEVPLLINILLIAPIWASIIFVLWYIIKEMIPFV